MKIHELGHIVFYVSNLEKSVHFYKDILGFNEIHRDNHTALFSSGRNHHEMLLIEVGGEAKPPEFPRVGLYHFGLKIGNSTKELQDAYIELQKHGVRIVGSGDHHITHSLYILDPDGNELELYVDVSDEWKNDSKAIMRPVKRLVL